MSEVFYLGPAGTFTHDAARLYFESLASGGFEACSTPPDVMRKLSSAGHEYGVVPIDASVIPELTSGNINAACMMIGEKLGRQLSRQ